MESSTAPDHRHGNGLSGLPGWARILGLVGIPGAIACFLVYGLATFAMAGIRDMNRELVAHAQVLALHDAEARRVYASVDRLLLRICIQTARTDADRGRCVSER